jgi:hypothetical protein
MGRNVLSSCIDLHSPPHNIERVGQTLGEQASNAAKE